MNKYLSSRQPVELFGSAFCPPRVVSEMEPGVLRPELCGKRVRYVISVSTMSVPGLWY